MTNKIIITKEIKPRIHKLKNLQLRRAFVMKETNQERLNCFDPETTQERQLYEENEYQYQQRMGYDMAINEIKPLLQDILKVLDKGNSTRNKIDSFFKENPKSTWQNARLKLGLTSNNLIAFHLPRIKLINRIKEVINDKS